MNATNPHLKEIQKLTLKKIPNEKTLEEYLLCYTKEQLTRLIHTLSLPISTAEKKSEIVQKLCNYFNETLFCVPNLVIQSKFQFFIDTIFDHVPNEFDVEKYNLFEQEDIAQLMHHGILFRYENTFFIPEDRKEHIKELLAQEDSRLKLARQLTQTAIASTYIYGALEDSHLLNLVTEHYPEKTYTSDFVEKVLRNVFVHTGNIYRKGILYPESFFTFTEAQKFIKAQEHGYYVFEKEEINPYLRFAEDPTLVPTYYEILNILNDGVTHSSNPDNAVGSLLLTKLTGTLKRHDMIDAVLEEFKRHIGRFADKEDQEYFSKLFIPYLLNMRHWTLGGYRYQEIYSTEKVERIEERLYTAHRKRFFEDNDNGLEEKKSTRLAYLNKMAKKKKKRKK